MKYTVGSRVMQGRREAQEDRSFVIENLLEFMIKHQIQVPTHLESTFKHALLLGVFDGHMGSNAASFCCKEMAIEIAQELCSLNSPSQEKQSTTKTEGLAESPPFRNDLNCPKKRKVEETTATETATASATETEAAAATPNSVLPDCNDLESGCFVDKEKSEDEENKSSKPSKALVEFETTTIEKTIQLCDVARALFRVFAKIDNRFLTKFRLNKDGSTALVVLIIHLHLFVAWVGDSRGVLGSTQRISFEHNVPIEMDMKEKNEFKDSSAKFFETDPYSVHVGTHQNSDVSRFGVQESAWLSSPLTVDHKPHRTDERRRIIVSGGILLYTAGVARVAKRGFEEQCRQLRNSGLSFGGSSSSQQPIALAVSRAIGDRDMKAGSELKTSLISPIPEVRYLKLDPVQDKLIILACDGVWDVISEQESVSIAQNLSASHEECFENSSSAIASKLVTLAFKKGSQDNLTALVLMLESSS